MEDTEFEDFKEYLSIQNPDVLKNCTEVFCKDLKQKFMLHIDKNTPNVFIPLMPRRASLCEDNTVPRVSVADSILGCLLAYYISVNDVLNASTYNGYFINLLEFDYCVKPNKKLVFDAEDTNEHWLLAYSKKTLNYKPRTIGKMFFASIAFNPNTIHGRNDIVGQLYISIDEDLEVALDSVQRLKKGYYRVLVDLTTLNAKKDRLSIYDVDKFKVTSISQDTFTNASRVSASTLSELSESIPLYKDW